MNNDAIRLYIGKVYSGTDGYFEAQQADELIEGFVQYLKCAIYDPARGWLAGGRGQGHGLNRKEGGAV